MPTLTSSDDFVIFKNSGSIIRSALGSQEILFEVLEPFHPEDISRIQERLGFVEKAQKQRAKEGEVLNESDYGLGAVSSIAGLELDDSNGNMLDELIRNSFSLIRSAFSRREILLAVYEASDAKTVTKAIQNLDAAFDKQNIRLKETSALSDNQSKCLEEIEAVLKRHKMSFEELISIRNSKTECGKNIIRFVKDGVEWGGLGRRPAVFKGMSSIEIENYRVDAIEYNWDKNSSAVSAPEK